MPEVAGPSSTRGSLVLVVLLLLSGLVAGCGEREGRAAEDETEVEKAEPGSSTVTGSRACRECHQRFYELWAPSHHGTAMQPFEEKLAREVFGEKGDPVETESGVYRYLLDDGKGWVVGGAPGGDEARHEVLHLMGGKNVFFLLTPHERGRLQVLPIAYDVREGAWYDTTASMVRHAIGHTDAPVHWTDPLLTFNTSCWSCHVSQLSVNYDAEADRYDSAWAEPGINCETCHGPGEEHIRVCREAGEGNVPEDLRLITQTQLSIDQRNDACAPCHAKAVVLSSEFQPGERYFDHFDLACFEDPDFYPDGRDLGENYTWTLWKRSPCVRSGQLDCIHCHTSSGRYRFQGEKANDACLPCHQDKMEDAQAHTRHRADSPGSRCIACHMPMTSFARMQRSDHSMLPPAPAVSAKHGSPNACTLCHVDEDAAWADAHVRSWRERDYQARMLLEADLVAEARARDWTRLDDMLAMIDDNDTDEILATSLIRLLGRSGDQKKVPVLLRALRDESPLVRSAAATALEPYAAIPQIGRALFQALKDDTRLVRLRAAGTLASMPAGELPPEAKETFDAALGELEASLLTRPDQWTAYYNHGNFLEQRGQRARALEAYERAHRLRPDQVPPLVNAAMLRARSGELEEAEALLRKSLEIDAHSPQALYNLGLLLAETGRVAEAKTRLEAAFVADASLGRAALNIAIMVAGEKDLDGAIAWAAKAVEALPHDPKVAWTYAYYLRERGGVAAAIDALESGLDAGAVSPEVYDLLGQLHVDRKDVEAARQVWLRAASDPRLPPMARRTFAARGQGRRPR